MNKQLNKLILSVLTLTAASRLDASVLLAGMNFYQAGTVENSFQTFHIWGGGGAQIWLRENNNWIGSTTGNFFLLQDGLNTFDFYASGNGVRIDEAGLRFTFSSQPPVNCSSGISAISSSGSNSFGVNPNWPPNLNPVGGPLNGNCTAPNTSLQWTNGTDSVELVSLSYLDHLSTGVNEVSFLQIADPNDQFTDHVGTFTLLVNGGSAAVPEASTHLTLGAGLVSLLVLKFRRGLNKSRC